MSNTELIKELRSLTQAGMKDCKDALEEANWDLQKAVDIVKVKGLNVVSGREGKVASEGRVDIAREANGSLAVMVEVNCQTDFVANSKDFTRFVQNVKHKLYDSVIENSVFTTDSVEAERKEVVSTTKENIVVRRWWGEQAQSPNARVFAYQHSNNKIGVLLTLWGADSVLDTTEFNTLGEDLAMQIAAMSPLAVNVESLDPTEVARQKGIFETQLAELNKPQAAWPKILEGKFNKWHSEVCLLNQESVIQPKTTVGQVVKNVGTKLGGEIQVVNFIRCQVGEGIDKKQDDLVNEVAKLM